MDPRADLSVKFADAPAALFARRSLPAEAGGHDAAPIDGCAQA